MNKKNNIEYRIGNFPADKERGKDSTKKIFLEVGLDSYTMSLIDEDWSPHIAPVPVGGTKEWKSNEIYIGVELRLYELLEIKEWMGYVEKKSNIRPEQLFFVQADGQKLPLPDRSVETVFFGNVFGDPAIKNEAKKKFIEETRRVLKPGGRVIILETRTPEVAKYGYFGYITKEGFTSWDYVKKGDRLEDLLREAGFTIIDWISTDDPKWGEEATKYAKKLKNVKGPYLSYEKPFLVYAQKVRRVTKKEKKQKLK